MPHDYIDVIRDGFEDFDRESITLDGIGAVRAVVIETTVEAALEELKPGERSVITVSARDERGNVVYSDTLVQQERPPISDRDAAVHRAIHAMNRA